jgi:peptidoglycan hydrolase-like protein with peptidoglycan-binding domain
MIRTLALVSTLVAASLSASALSAQSSATTTPPAAPAMKHAPTVHAKADSTKMGAAATTTRHAAWTKEQIKEAQEGLAKAGFYKGTATGVFNKGTRKALRAYQKQNKLPVTGRLSDDVLAKLKSA